MTRYCFYVKGGVYGVSSLLQGMDINLQVIPVGLHEGRILQENHDGKPLPYCPSSIVNGDLDLEQVASVAEILAGEGMFSIVVVDDKRKEVLRRINTRDGIAELLRRTKTREDIAELLRKRHMEGKVH